MTFEEFRKTDKYEEKNSYLLRETNWSCEDIDKLFFVSDWSPYAEEFNVKSSMDNLWEDTYVRKKKRYSFYR